MTSSRPMTMILVLVSLGILGGCSDGPTSTTPDEAAVGQISSPEKIRRIESLKDAWDAAWAAKDAAAYASNYAVDADWIAPTGAIATGRDEIRARHESLFAGPFATSTQTTEVRRTVFLTGGLAMVDLDVALTGYSGLPPGLQETAPGVLRVRVKWILVQDRGSWIIFAQQITAVAPAP